MPATLLLGVGLGWAGRAGGDAAALGVALVVAGAGVALKAIIDPRSRTPRASRRGATASRERAHQACAIFDALINDMQMRVMDGYQAARLFRVGGYDGPIIALTAHAMASDREKCIDCGCTDYISKPIDRGRLVALVASAIAADRVGVATEA